MRKTQTINNPQGFTMIELMIVIVIVAVLATLATPNFIAYRNKTFCSMAETDAGNVIAAISDYFGNAYRVNTPTMDDLEVATKNTIEIYGINPNINVTVAVTDQSRRCPVDYQTNTPGWDSNYVFTRRIR